MDSGRSHVTLGIRMRVPGRGCDAPAASVGGKRTLLPWLGILAFVPILVAACGGGVPEEEHEALQQELQRAQLQVQSLEQEKEELRTAATTSALTALGELISIEQLMALPPTVVELKPNSATIQMITKDPTTCSIAHGLTTDYGEISTDDRMMSGGHTNHTHTLTRLQPDSVYHYKWGLLGPDGTVYGSKDLTFKTPPAGAGASQ